MLALRICSWCKCVLGVGQTIDGRPTHGICKRCMERQMAKLEELPCTSPFGCTEGGDAVRCASVETTAT